MQVFRFGVPLVVASILLLSACDETVTADTGSSASAAEMGSVIPYGTPERAGSVNFESDEHAALRQQYGLLRSQIIDVFEQPGQREDKSARIRDFLREHAASPLAPFLEQYASHKMLELLLSEESTDLEAVSFYTRLLIKNQNPDAELIHRALIQLSDEWSRAEVRSAGKVTAERALRWAERVCGDCTERSNSKTSTNAGVETKRRAILSAVRGLNQLAGP